MTAMKSAVLIGFGLLALGSLHGDSQNRSLLKTEAVAYLFPEQVTVAAGKPSPVTLHFRIASGLHINSHTPSEDYLIPTTFSIPDGGGVRLDKAEYPAAFSSRCPTTEDEAERVLRRLLSAGADCFVARQSSG